MSDYNIYSLNSGMMEESQWMPTSMGGLLRFGRSKHNPVNIIELGSSTDFNIQSLLDIVHWGWKSGQGVVYQPPAGSLLAKLFKAGLAEVKYGRFTYPLICICHRCGGPQSLYLRGVSDEELSSAKACREVQLAAWAFKAKDWSNVPPTGDYCQCDEKWKGTQFPIKPIEDSGWKAAASSIPSRGIRDYSRTIKFERPLSKDELLKVREYLQLDPKCPGWTGIGTKIISEGCYGFSTTWDSSD